PGTRLLSGEFRAALLRTLLERGFPVSCVRSESLIDAAANSVLLVMGDFESETVGRTPWSAAGPLAGLHEWLETPERPTGGSAADQGVRPTVWFQRLHDFDPAQAADFADQVRNELGLEKPGTWKPWFPVIDF